MKRLRRYFLLFLSILGISQATFSMSFQGNAGKINSFSQLAGFQSVKSVKFPFASFNKSCFSQQIPLKNFSQLKNFNARNQGSGWNNNKQHKNSSSQSEHSFFSNAEWSTFRASALLGWLAINSTQQASAKVSDEEKIKCKAFLGALNKYYFLWSSKLQEILNNKKTSKFFLEELTFELQQNNKWRHNFHNLFCEFNKKQKKILINTIADGLDKILFYDHFDRIFNNCNDKQKDILVTVIVRNLTQGRECVGLDRILKNCTDNQKDILNSAIVECFAKKSLKSSAIDSDVRTQTNAHILDNYFNIRLRVQNPKVLNVFERAIKSEEKVLQRTERKAYVFYHAQMWKLYWLELLYTKLWEAKYKQEAKNYIFTRFPEDRNCQTNAKKQKSEKFARRMLLDDSTHNNMKYYRSKLLFLNYALFGNSTLPGSCSAYYFLNDSNVNEPNIRASDILAQFGLQKYFYQYKQEFNQLQKEFDNLSDGHGNLMQIVMPEEYIKKNVYPAVPGGLKNAKKVFIPNTGWSRFIFSGQEIYTDDVVTIIESLKVNRIKDWRGSDQQEFCWIVTDDSIHKAQEAGVQINNFNTADPEKFEKIMNKLDAIVKEIVEQSRKENPEFDSPTPRECYKQYKDFNKTLKNSKLNKLD